MIFFPKIFQIRKTRYDVIRPIERSLMFYNPAICQRDDKEVYYMVYYRFKIIAASFWNFLFILGISEKILVLFLRLFLKMNYDLCL